MLPWFLITVLNQQSGVTRHHLFLSFFSSFSLYYTTTISNITSILCSCYLEEGVTQHLFLFFSSSSLYNTTTESNTTCILCAQNYPDRLSKTKSYTTLPAYYDCSNITRTGCRQHYLTQHYLHYIYTILPRQTTRNITCILCTYYYLLRLSTTIISIASKNIPFSLIYHESLDQLSATWLKR